MRNLSIGGCDAMNYIAFLCRRDVPCDLLPYGSSVNEADGEDETRTRSAAALRNTYPEGHPKGSQDRTRM